MKAIRQRSMKREEGLLRALLELYQDMPLRIPTKELNDLDSYPRLEEVRRCSNKELTVTRELLKKDQSLKEYATLGKRKSFQYVSGVPGRAYNPLSYFRFERAVILNFYVKRVRELGTISSERLKLGVILEERVVEPSVHQLAGQISFECVLWDGPLKTSILTM